MESFVLESLPNALRTPSKSIIISPLVVGETPTGKSEARVRSSIP